MLEERAQRDAPAIPADAVRLHLDAILKSQAFAGSERLRKVLWFLVERTLNGQADQLKEYTVGVEVFSRVACPSETAGLRPVLR